MEENTTLTHSGVAIKGLAYPTPSPENPDDPLASSNHVITVTAQVCRLVQVLGYLIILLGGMGLPNYASP